MLFPKPKLFPISLVPRNPSSTSSASKRPRTSSYHPSAHGRRRWSRNGSSPNGGPWSNGHDAWTNGCTDLYACPDGTWTCVVWWTDDGWTWVWATGLGTAAADVSGADATPTSTSTSPPATPSTVSSRCSCSTKSPHEAADFGRTHPSRNILGPPSIPPTPLYPPRFETVTIFSSATPSRTKWIWTKAW